MNNKIHIKQDDTVQVLSGNDRGKTGKVLEVSPKQGKVIVEGINMVKKHVKPRRMGDPGGIVDAPAPMYAAKVQLVCPKCNKPSRTGKVTNEDGTKSRVCKSCNKTF